MNTKNLKSIAILAVICFLTASSKISYAQNSQADKHEKSLLWEISGNGLEKPSYLFGTLHIIDSAKYFLDEKVKEKIAKCEKVIFEVNTADPQYQQKSVSVLLLKNDSLDNIISAGEYKKLKVFFTEKLNLPLDKLKKIKPYYLMAFISQLSMPKHFKSYEEELKKISTEHGKEIQGISTVEKESEILVDRIPLKIQGQMLIDAANDYKKLPEVTDTLVKAYLNQDIDQYHKITKKDAKPEIVYESMFAKRHEVWLPNMEQLMGKHSCFFAFGVAHLSGQVGLIKLLRQKGYKVKAVNTKK